MPRAGIVVALIVLGLGFGSAIADAAWRPGLAREPGIKETPEYTAAAIESSSGAIAADGTGVAAWWADRTKTDPIQRSLRMMTTTAPGRFARPVTLASAGRSAVAVAAKPGGALLVAYLDDSHVRIVFRTATGRPLHKRVLADDSAQSINALAAAADTGGGWTVLERSFPSHTPGASYDVRAIRVAADGHARSDQDLGPGAIGFTSQTTGLPVALAANGRTWLAFGPAPGIGPTSFLAPAQIHSALAGRPFGALFTTGDANATDLAVAVDGPRSAITWTSTTNRGESGAYGLPRIALTDPDGRSVADGRGPDLPRPSRAFGATAARLGGARWLLGWQEKTGRNAFSRVAPVRASVVAADGTVGAPATLLSTPIARLTLLPVSGSRTVLTGVTRTGAVLRLLDADGRPSPLAAPFTGRSDDADAALDTLRVTAAGRWLLALRVDQAGLRYATEQLKAVTIEPREDSLPAS